MKKKVEQFKTKIKVLRPANIVTFLNAALGLLSIFYSIKLELKTAALLMIAAVVADYFDGKIAKWTRDPSTLGLELDSLADTISFGVAPVVFGYMINDSTPAIIIYTLFVISGITRLAKFNIQETRGYWFGLPITNNGWIIPLFFFIKLAPKYLPIVFLVLAILMTSKFRIKKFF